MLGARIAEWWPTAREARLSGDFVILAGSGTMDADDGASFAFTPGGLVAIPNGWDGVCEG
jgi:uncharacterized cupin superfamily protein